jgi:peptidyl-prolyl cis-trans isomerase B (cyclophilin B)
MKNFSVLKKTAAVAAASAMLALTGCGKELDISKSEGKAASQSGNTIVFTLHPDQAPITCKNFEELVESGFYDGLTFHRVVDGFMAQGGDPEGTGNGGSEKTIKGEFAANGVANRLSHQRGVVSMARSKEPDSASSQFFICYNGNYASSLDGNYAAFANVTEGMEVVDEFLKCERKLNAMGEVATPVYPITITKAVMLEAKEGEPHRAEFTVTYSPRGA